jgi:hypothetical protein
VRLVGMAREDPAPEIHAVCDERKLPLHVFPLRREMHSIGLQRNAVYRVRTDGHVARASRGATSVLTSFSMRAQDPRR